MLFFDYGLFLLIDVNLFWDRFKILSGFKSRWLGIFFVRWLFVRLRFCRVLLFGNIFGSLLDILFLGNKRMVMFGGNFWGIFLIKFILDM